MSGVNGMMVFGRFRCYKKFFMKKLFKDVGILIMCYYLMFFSIFSICFVSVGLKKNIIFYIEFDIFEMSK